jgi:hypothetical protein
MSDPDSGTLSSSLLVIEFRSVFDFCSFSDDRSFGLFGYEVRHRDRSFLVRRRWDRRLLRVDASG